MDDEQMKKDEEKEHTRGEEFNRKLGELCAEFEVEYLIGFADLGKTHGSVIVTKRPLRMAEVIHSLTMVVKDFKEMEVLINGPDFPGADPGQIVH